MRQGLFLFAVTSLLVTSAERRRRLPLDGKRIQVKCEPVEVEKCSRAGYGLTDVTLSPEDVFDQDHAAEMVSRYGLLIESGCARELLLFICSLYVPICIEDYPRFLPPCRFMCDRAREGCEPRMKQYGYEWPEAFNCSRFPPLTPTNKMCFHDTDDDVNVTLATTTSPLPPLATTEPDVTSPRASSSSPTMTSSSSSSGSNGSSSCRCECRWPMRLRSNQMTSLGEEECVTSCRSPYFSKSQMGISTTFLLIFSLLAFLSSLCACASYLVDRKRLRQTPERHIVYVSVCYLVISAGFLIRFMLGHEQVACDQNGVLHHGISTSSIPCAVVFVLTYYFFMAATIWWVLLSFTYFLLAGFRLTASTLGNISPYYHAIAWTLPAVQTITVFARSAIDGDPLTGMCRVGSDDVTNLRAYVITPLFVYLVASFVFVTLGLFHLIRNRRRRQETTGLGQESALGRFGLFLLLYVMPTVVLASCHLYEWYNHARWRTSFMCGSCHHGNPPNLAILVLRHASSLVVALTNCVWLLASASTWLEFAKLHTVLTATRGRARDGSTHRHHVASPAARCQCCTMMMTSSTTSSALISASSSSGANSPVDCSDDERCSLAPRNGGGHHSDDVRL